MYILGVLIPSAVYSHFGDYRNAKTRKESERMYFSKVWERSADYLGGVDRNNYNDLWYYRNLVPW